MNNIKLPNSVKTNQLLTVDINHIITASSLSVKELTDNLTTTAELEKQVSELTTNYLNVDTKLDEILNGSNTPSGPTPGSGSGGGAGGEDPIPGGDQ